jgi:hypothetical protein
MVIIIKLANKSDPKKGVMWLNLSRKEEEIKNRLQ